MSKQSHQVSSTECNLSMTTMTKWLCRVYTFKLDKNFCLCISVVASLKTAAHMKSHVFSLTVN